MALGVERVGHRLFDDLTRRRANRAAAAGVDAATAAPRPARRRRGAVGRAGLGGRQEALEVTEPIASVASRVDPVVAQPAGVAPGSDRVRVHAKQPGGLGDRQGRVRGSGGEGGRHVSLRKCEVDRPEPTNLTVLANSPMVPARSTRRVARSVGRRRASRPPTRPRSRRPPAGRTAGRRRALDPGRSCAGRRRSASGLGEAASAALAQTSHAITAVATVPHRSATRGLVMTRPRSRPRCRR